MLRTHAPRLVLVAALAGLVAACSGETGSDAATPAADAPPPVLKEREENFEGIGASFKAVRGELEKDAPDFALIAAKAGDINTRAQKITGHFPLGTSTADGVKTEALPAIWAAPGEFQRDNLNPDFKAAAQKLIDESAKLASLAGGGDKAAVGAQAMAMGGACKGCHDQFRLDDKK